MMVLLSIAWMMDAVLLLFVLRAVLMLRSGSGASRMMGLAVLLIAMLAGSMALALTQTGRGPRIAALVIAGWPAIGLLVMGLFVLLIVILKPDFK